MKCEEMYWAKCIYVKISKTVGRLFTENKKKCVSFWLLKKKLILKKIKLKTVERKLYNCSQQLENTWNEMKFCVFKTFKTFIACIHIISYSLENVQFQKLAETPRLNLF